MLVGYFGSCVCCVIAAHWTGLHCLPREFFLIQLPGTSSSSLSSCTWPLDGSDLTCPYASHLRSAVEQIRNRCTSSATQTVATKLKQRGPAHRLHVDVPLESYCMAALFSPGITFTVMLSGSAEGGTNESETGMYTLI